MCVCVFVFSMWKLTIGYDNRKQEIFLPRYSKPARLQTKPITKSPICVH
jgi:hypothetical protein